MTPDLRTLAMISIKQLGRLAERFPVHSNGRNAIRRTIRELQRDYLATDVQKKRFILAAIAENNSKISDIVHVTGLTRCEVESLLSEMESGGFISRLIERATKDGRGGRPFFRFTINKAVFEAAGETSAN